MSENPNLDFMGNAEEEIAGRIRAESFFSNLTVLTCAVGDIAKKITEALAGLGLFLLVEVKPQGKIPYVGDVTMWPIWITITENTALNRGTGKAATGKTGRMAFEALARLVDKDLGIADPTVEEVADSTGREIIRVVGLIGVTIKENP